MPIHEYKCQACGGRTEALQKLRDKPLQKCPKCGGPLVKLISSPAIQFKGSGFYITDYSHKNIPSKEEKARDSKPADKPADKPAEKTADKHAEKTGDKAAPAKGAAKKDAPSSASD
jgi:putative FmdB family regulatory protein